MKTTEEIVKIVNDSNGVNSMLVMNSQEELAKEIESVKWFSEQEIKEAIEKIRKAHETDIYENSDIVCDKIIKELELEL